MKTCECHPLVQSPSREERTRILPVALSMRNLPRLHRTHAAFGNEAFVACSSQVIDVRLRVRWLVHSLPSLQIRLVELCVAGVRQQSNVDTRWVSMDPQRRPTQSVQRHRHGVQGRSHGYPWGLGDIADNKTDGWASCAVWTGFPNSAAHRGTPLGLRASDRLEPSHQMADVM